jgi:hypothetical protein
MDERNLIHRTMATTEIALDAEATAAWDAITARPARDVPGLRRLMDRPSPFEK